MIGRLERGRARAFTLIELLVVIAIIGILAAMLFPSVQGVMVKAKAAKVGSNGKQVWLGLQNESLDRESIDLAPVWPRTGQFADATAFWKICISSNYLQGYDYSFFSAPGLSAANSTNSADFTDGRNAWAVVLDCGQQTLASTPFMFTRNINVGKNAAANATGKLNDGGNQHDLGASLVPFGDKTSVVVSYGGSVKTLKNQELTSKFNPANAANKYIQPADRNAVN
jgi:prepilin-type N-terminal cleavage/methylation domain-containing protein